MSARKRLTPSQQSALDAIKRAQGVTPGGLARERGAMTTKGVNTRMLGIDSRIVMALARRGLVTVERELVDHAGWIGKSFVIQFRRDGVIYATAVTA